MGLEEVSPGSQRPSISPGFGKGPILSIAGLFLTVGIVALVATLSGAPLLIFSFASSAVLLHLVPGLPTAHPRNVIGGHMIAAGVGVACYQLLGTRFLEPWWALALAVALAGLGMLLTDTLHSPAGSTALIASATGATPIFLVWTGVGATILVLLASLFNRLMLRIPYPPPRGTSRMAWVWPGRR